MSENLQDLGGRVPRRVDRALDRRHHARDRGHRALRHAGLRRAARSAPDRLDRRLPARPVALFVTDPAAGGVRGVPVLIGADEMARIDEAAQRLGVSEDALMESAGAAVTEVALTELQRLAEGVAGPGRAAGASAAGRRAVRPGQQRRRRLRRRPAPGRHRASRAGRARGRCLAPDRCGHRAQLERAAGDGRRRVAGAVRHAHARAAAATARADRRGDAADRRAARLRRVGTPARADRDGGRPAQRDPHPRAGRRPSVRRRSPSTRRPGST